MRTILMFIGIGALSELLNHSSELRLAGDLQRIFRSRNGVPHRAVWVPILHSRLFAAPSSDMNFLRAHGCNYLVNIPIGDSYCADQIILVNVAKGPVVTGPVFFANKSYRYLRREG